jgi:hypothetical protein
VALTVQALPAARLPGQSCVAAKPLPVATIAPIVSAPVPVLDSVTARAALVWPTVTLPKASEVADRLTAGAAATGM